MSQIKLTPEQEQEVRDVEQLVAKLGVILNGESLRTAETALLATLAILHQNELLWSASGMTFPEWLRAQSETHAEMSMFLSAQSERLQ